MGTPEARLGEIFKAMAKDAGGNDAEDIWKCKEELFMHAICAAKQPIEPNTIPINDIIGRLQPPGPDNNHIQQARNYTTRDREHIINTHVEATNRYYNTISSLLQEGPFKWWFQRCFSSTMIIYGRDDEASYPLAYMCAALARKLPDIPYAHPLTFFCHLGNTKEIPHRGVAAMLRSLITQVLAHNSQNRYVMNKLVGDMWRPEERQLKDVGVLFEMFASVVRSVTGGTIICMIDGVDRLAKYDSGNTHAVMDRLSQLARELDQDRENRRGKRKLKLLLTFYNPNDNIRFWFPDNVLQLHLPAPNPGGAGEGRA